jgi:hypothetical protein
VLMPAPLNINIFLASFIICAPFAIKLSIPLFLPQTFLHLIFITLASA